MEFTVDFCQRKLGVCCLCESIIEKGEIEWKIGHNDSLWQLLRGKITAKWKEENETKVRVILKRVQKVVNISSIHVDRCQQLGFWYFLSRFFLNVSECLVSIKQWFFTMDKTWIACGAVYGERFQCFKAWTSFPNSCRTIKRFNLYQIIWAFSSDHVC